MATVRRWAGAAAWLDAARVRRWSAACLAVHLVCAVVCVAGTHGWLVKLARPSTTDFVSFYAAGTLAGSAQPALAYDRDAHYAAEQSATRAGIAYVHFFYPPVYLLYCRVLARAPYLVAFIGFELLGLALCAGVVRLIWGRVPGWWWLPLASFSPLWWNIGFGQNALMTAGLFGLGTVALHRGRDWLGGAVLGLLFYKPHSGLLVPVALLAAGNWRAVAGAGVSVAASIGASVLLFGWETWQRFLRVLGHSFGQFSMGSVTAFATTINVWGAARDHGASEALAWGMQATMQLAAAAVVAWCWRAPARRGGAEYALLISAALLAMPVVLFYDLTALVIATAWIVRDACARGFLPGERLGLACIWLGGLLCYPAGRAGHVPLGLACVLASLALSARRCRTRYPCVYQSDVTLGAASCAP